MKNKTMGLIGLNELFLSVPAKNLNALPKKHKAVILETWEKLKNRDINPSGYFDRGGRWYATNEDCIDCRTPSRSYPYSEMNACRTLRYVVSVYCKYNLRYARKATINDLIVLV